MAIKAFRTRLAMLLAGTLLTLAFTAQANRSPLILEGKESLFQRVLTAPGAKLYDGAGGKATADVVPFSALYVYARKSAGGHDWLEVGSNSHGKLSGWLPAADSLPWHQGLTVAFRDPAGQDRALLYRSREDVRKVIADPARYRQLYQSAIRGELPVDAPVIAIQPAANVDIRRNFYLVPIQGYEDLFVGSESGRLLKVSSVPLKPAKKAANGKPAAATPDKPFRVGLVFVMDATLSMQPFIERTRAAIRNIYDHLQTANLPGEMHFGLVAFRDDPAAAPRLEYRARTYARLADGKNAEQFFGKVQEVNAARFSSQDFKEDSYSGIRQAIEDMRWDDYDARYIILVTDAGARESNDPRSGTGMSARGIARLASDKGIAVLTLHLLTDARKADHRRARKQYEELSAYPGVGSLYYGVPTGDVKRFGYALDLLANQLASQIRLGSSKRVIEAPATVAQAPAPDAKLEELQSRVTRLGYALQLQYLRRHDKGDVPRVFDAWVLDRDPSRPERRSLDVRVLLTRDQLSDLHDLLKRVLQTAEEGLLSPKNFLNDLKSLAAAITRDPEQLSAATRASSTSGGNLADLGFMREYIDDLPYKPEVMDVSLADWEEWSAKRQLAFIHRLEEKIRYYKALHDHTDLWISLDQGPVSGDSVFPIALEMLP